jgi:AraC-like DNA-binding protein
VFDGGQTIPAQVWLVPHVRGTPRWYVSTKTPLRDPGGTVIGLAGVMYQIETPEEQERAFCELLPVIRHIDNSYDSDISMKQMAAMAGLSTTHFNARFREIFGMTPTRYVLSRRIEHSRRLLTETSKDIAEISVELGFCDQSHFTKRFRSVTGLTPRQYRKRFRRVSV